MALRPVSFEWKDHPEQGTKLGLIAQDVLEVIPEAVRTHDFVVPRDGGPMQRIELERLGMAYTDLIPVLIDAIQEQQEEIESMREVQQEIERKDQRITDLEARLARLEALLSSE